MLDFEDTFIVGFKKCNLLGNITFRYCNYFSNEVDKYKLNYK